MAAAVAPAQARAIRSVANPGAAAQPSAVTVQATAAHPITRYLPKRSPIGPKKSCARP